MPRRQCSNPARCAGSPTRLNLHAVGDRIATAAAAFLLRHDSAPKVLFHSRAPCKKVHMRLADFIEAQPALILAEWVAFAASCAPAAVDMTKTELRDHASQMLGDIVIDLRSYQSESQRKQKASGATTDDHHAETAAEAHGADRAASGFTVEEMASEYRAFRASVIRLWTSANDGLSSADLEDLMRFNESIDKALSESIAFHAGESRAADRALFVSEQRYRSCRKVRRAANSKMHSRRISSRARSTLRASSAFARSCRSAPTGSIARGWKGCSPKERISSQQMRNLT